MNDPAKARYVKKWLPRDQRIEMKLDALLASVVGAQTRYDHLLRERFPEIDFDSDD